MLRYRRQLALTIFMSYESKENINIAFKQIENLNISETTDFGHYMYRNVQIMFTIFFPISKTKRKVT